MGEWLTNGQMLDQIKIGEIAKPNTNDASIKRFNDGLYWLKKDGDIDERVFFTDLMLMNYKWKIAPNYVQFQEAMKALKDGRTILQELDGDTIWKYKYVDELICTWYKTYGGEWESWKQCNGQGALCSLEGKWIIED